MTYYIGNVDIENTYTGKFSLLSVSYPTIDEAINAIRNFIEQQLGEAALHKEEVIELLDELKIKPLAQTINKYWRYKDGSIFIRAIVLASPS